MTETKSEVTEVIEKILAKGKRIYYIAKLMQLEQIQVKRIRATGRCQPSQLKKLESILDEVSRETHAT